DRNVTGVQTCALPISPARSDAAVTVSAETASEDSAENSRSAPSSEPLVSFGIPGHTLRVSVAGKSAARAAVSISGDGAAHRLPTVVIAATATTAPIPNPIAPRLDGPVAPSRRRAA